MGQQIRVCVCYECGKEFLMEKELKQHRMESGHRLSTSRAMDEFPITLNPNGVTKLGPDFNPSIMTLQRILGTLMTKGSMSRTNLAQAANMQYTRLSKYLVLLTYRNYIQYSMCDGKVTVSLTNRGMEFADNLTKLATWDRMCAIRDGIDT